MSLTLDTSDDWKVWDGTESVTFASVRKKGGDSADEFTVPNAKRRAITKRELAASQGAYIGADVNWFLPDKQVREAAGIGFEAKSWDRIVQADGTEWTVLEAHRGKIGETWKCVSRNLKIVHALRDTITIERAVVAFDEVAATERTAWKPVYRSLTCRVQPQDQVPVVERGLRGATKTYTVFLSRQLDTDTFSVGECRVSWTVEGRTRYLDITSYHFAEQIGELPRIEAVGRV